MSLPYWELQMGSSGGSFDVECERSTAHVKRCTHMFGTQLAQVKGAD